MAKVDKQTERAKELCNHIKMIRGVKKEDTLKYVGALSQLLEEKDYLIKELSNVSDSYPGVKEALNLLEEV